MMVSEVVAGRIRRHVGEQHVKRRAPDGLKIDISEIRFLQNNVGRQADGVNRFQIHSDDRSSRTDPAGGDLTL